MKYIVLLSQYSLINFHLKDIKIKNVVVINRTKKIDIVVIKSNNINIEYSTNFGFKKIDKISVDGVDITKFYEQSSRCGGGNLMIHENEKEALNHIAFLLDGTYENNIINVPSKNIGKIIGKGGSVIKSLSELFNKRLKVEKNS